jgi:DNA-damage-inducible protein J
MVKTLQVRIDENLKVSADSLFASLGLDTSTAVRMFLTAAIDSGGIPFSIMRKPGRDVEIQEAIARRESGARFYTSDEFFANMKSAIKEATVNA